MKESVCNENAGFQASIQASIQLAGNFSTFIFQNFVNY